MKRCFLLPWIDIYPLSARPSALKEAFSPLSRAKSPLATAQKPPREGKYPLQEARHLLRRCFLLPWIDISLLSEAQNAPSGAFSPTFGGKIASGEGSKAGPRGKISSQRGENTYLRGFSLTMERESPFSAAIFRCRDAAKGGSPAESLVAPCGVFPSLSRRLLAGERETRSATRVAPAARWLYRRRLGGKRHRETCQRAAGGTAGEPPALRASPLARAFSEARSAKRRPLIRLRHLLPGKKTPREKDSRWTNARERSKKSSRRAQNRWVSSTESTEQPLCPRCLCGS